MTYASAAYPATATEAFDRFWNHGIGVTEVGSVAYFGLNRARTKKKFTKSDYDFDKVERAVEEMLLARIVDNFQSYVVDLLLEIYLVRPEIVPKGSVTYRELFGSADILELRKIAIEKTVSSYGYMNIVDLSDEIKKSLSFPIFDHWLTKRRVKRIVEIRNLIVHNRSTINETFIEKVGCKHDRFGSQVSVPNAVGVLRYLDALANDIDCRAAVKFMKETVSNG